MPQTPLKLPLVGQDLERSALKLNAQVTINMYPDVGGTEAANERALTPTPGLKLLGNTSEGEIRGFVTHSDRLFCVSGNKFIEIEVDDNKTLTFTTRGTVDSAASIIGLESNLTQVLISAGGSTSGYLYYPEYFNDENPANTFTQLSDYPGANGIAQVDGYFFTISPNSEQINASQVATGATWPGLSTTSANYKSDDLVAIQGLNGELWAFGHESIQVYYNSANATGFPFSQRTNAKIDFGLAAKNSVALFDNGIMFLDSRGYVTLAQGYQVKTVSTISVNEAIRGYTKVDDAIAFTYSEKGHLFYQITFPTADATWVYDGFTNAWHRRSTYINNVEGRHLGNAYIRYKNIDFVGSHLDGKIYEFDAATTQDDTYTILRERTSQHIHQNRQMVFVDEIELYVDTKNIAAGTTPQIMFQYSKDGGYTWSNELWRSLGQNGDYRRRVVWNRLGRARNWTFRFRVSDAVSPTFLSGFARVRVGS